MSMNEFWEAFVCVCVWVQPAPLSVCRGSHGPSKGLSTEAIKQYVCWNNVFDLAAGQQQVLGGPAWSCCSLPALICRPGTSLPFPVSSLPSHLCLPSSLPLFLFLPLPLCFFSLLSFLSLTFSVSLSLSASHLIYLPLSYLIFTS